MLLLLNSEKLTPRANCLGWWQGQQTKGVLARCTELELVGSQPHIPSASFPCTLVAGEDTGRSMQDSMVSDDAFLVS